MATQNDTNFRTFTATAVAIAEFSRVKVDTAGLILVCGATDSSIGIVQHDVAASGQATVKLWEPTQFMIASAAITTADKLQDAASGKVATLATGTATAYQALGAATADGDIIEVAAFR